ncbi:hypothetical protein EVAR_17263_1 [Eumeta japonica]|uniref:Uncharacterized protein n=1 Tax=Eumeta variegata TaxID=151549 RepID=A0A4C1TT12_EUMVA|nr:hypothetical protein EVAR_17263_1 [Eumeta japonica]
MNVKQRCTPGPPAPPPSRRGAGAAGARKMIHPPCGAVGSFPLLLFLSIYETLKLHTIRLARGGVTSRAGDVTRTWACERDGRCGPPFGRSPPPTSTPPPNSGQ